MMLSTAVLLSVCFVGVFTACPYGFTLHGSSCYLVVGHNSTWIGAKKYCDVMGGDLAVVESQTEQQHLFNALKQFYNTETIPPINYWLDGTNVGKDEEFRWMGKYGNSKPISSYTNWAAGQPDNDVDGLTKNCLEMTPDVHWNGLDCNAKRNFICKASKEWKPKPVVG